MALESNNPVFGRQREFQNSGYARFDTNTASAAELQDMYQSPSATSAQTGRMTIDDVVMKTASLFGVLLVAAAITFITMINQIKSNLVETGTLAVPGTLMGIVIVSAIVGLVLSLVITFSRTIRPPLMLAYAAFEGVFVGGISAVFEVRWDGIVVQAVLGTLGAFAAMLVLYRTGVLRATPRFQRMLMIAGVGYLVFAVLNLLLSSFNVIPNVYSVGGLGLLISAFGVALASLFLVLDFDYIEQGIRNGVPARFAWTAAFGLTVTLIWLYLEILRLLAILRGNN